MMSEAAMVRILKRYAFVVEDVDRRGNVRLYYRRKGFTKVRLPGPVGSPEFEAAYSIALAAAGHPGPPLAASATPNTWRWLCHRYFHSAEFKQLDETNTQRPRRRILESTWDEPLAPGSELLIGDCPLDRFTAKVVRVLRDRKASYPDAANNRIKAIRSTFKWAIESEVVTIEVNPARDVKRLRTRPEGYHAWSDDDIRRFEERWPVGTKERLAFALLRHLGVRRSDVVRLGKQHLKDGCLKFTMRKGRRRSPTTLELPMLPELRRIIEASPAGDLTFLVTDYGRSYSEAGFGIRFREWCNAAGLRHCSAHGLRKSAASSLAEHGATAHMLKAWFGWKSLKEAERYTRAASQKTLARSVVDLMARRDGSGT